jgi:hypothetical protein
MEEDLRPRPDASRPQVRRAHRAVGRRLRRVPSDAARKRHPLQCAGDDGHLPRRRSGQDPDHRRHRRPRRAAGAARQRDLNYLTTRKIKGYRLETDMMLFNLPLAGTTFRKFGFDERRKVPWAEYVLPEHVVMPYSAASLDTTPRYAVILPKTSNWVESRMASGFFRTVELTEQPTLSRPRSPSQGQDRRQVEHQPGRDNLVPALRSPHRLLLRRRTRPTLPACRSPTSSRSTAYSNEVLSITPQLERRRYRLRAPAGRRPAQVHAGLRPLRHRPYQHPRRLTESATSHPAPAGRRRHAVANLPAGYKTKQARVKDDSSRSAPASGATSRSAPAR